METKSIKINSADIKSYKKTKKRRLWLRILLISLGVIVVSVGVVALIVIGKLTDDNYDSLYNNQAAAAATPAPTTTESQQFAVTSTPVPTPPFDIEYNGKRYIKNDHIVNLLFLGIDTNTQRRINMKGYRSDMMMVCAIDTETKKVTLISIPRDTKTTVYKLNKDTGEIIEPVQDKINTAYSKGGGIDKYSFKNSMDCVQMFLERRCELEQPLGFSLDIPVYMYASMDIDGIQHVAKSVGGVDVTLDSTIPGVGRKGQTVHLVYGPAETYLRDRHNSEGGDLGRDHHHQTFMIALAKKIKSLGARKAIEKLYDDVQRFVHTNLDINQILDLAELLNYVDIDSIQMLGIPGEGSKPEHTWYYFPDEAATLQMLLDVYYTEVS